MTPEETKALAEKIWRRCGFYQKTNPSGFHYWRKDTDGNYDWARPYLPPLTHDNFWKWAVPKLQEKGLEGIEFGWEKGESVCVLVFEIATSDSLGSIFATGLDPDPALAAFKAIENLIDQEVTDDVEA